MLIIIDFMSVFFTKINVRWSDCDMNQHVRHSAYYDYGAHSRIRFFNENGYSSSQLKQLNIGPIIFKEECSFIKELKLNDVVTVNILKGEVNENGSRWTFHHELFNQKKEKVAHVTLNGAFLNLVKRKLTIPPEKLAEALKNLPIGEKYYYQK